MIKSHQTILSEITENPPAIARIIDHTLLKPEAIPGQIERLCDEAVEFNFASVCVNPVYVSLAHTRLSGTNIPVCTVVGFPLGASHSKTKRFEAQLALDQGAKEIDMVLPIGALKTGLQSQVEEDIHLVVDVCHQYGGICKVILETALLTEKEIRLACRVSHQAGADFVKTSTGFGPGGATVQAVRIMCEEVARFGLGVKAAGGIRTFADALEMVRVGATRIGASAGVQIVHQAKEYSSAN